MYPIDITDEDAPVIGAGPSIRPSEKGYSGRTVRHSPNSHSGTNGWRR